MFSQIENYESFNPSREMRTSSNQGDFNPSFAVDQDLTNFKFSLNNVRIRKKKDLFSKGEIMVAWVISDDVSDDPIKIGKTEIFENIRNGDVLPLGPSGITLYRSENKIPSFLDFRIIVIESDKGIRDFGDALEEIRQNKTYKGFRDAIIKASSLAAPTAALVTAGSDFALKMIAKVMSLNKDDQLLLVEGSYDDVFDDLGVIYGPVQKRSRYAKIEFESAKI